MPLDCLIAKNQVDRTLAGGETGIPYITETLSADAFEQIERIKEQYPEEVNQYESRLAFEAYDENRFDKPDWHWQNFNLTWNKVMPKLDIPKIRGAEMN